MKIVNAESRDYSAKARGILEQLGGVVLADANREMLLDLVGDADILIVRLRNQIDRAVFDRAERLKIIVTATTGTNHIALDAAREHGVTVLSLKDEQEFLKTVTATAELTWGLLLNLVRHIPAAADHVAVGQWDRDRFKGVELQSKTIGILGYGRLGVTIARYAEAFGMRVLAHDRYVNAFPDNVTPVSLNALLEQSDIVSIHVPLNTETAGYLGAAAIAKMKDGVIVLNTARGEILDEDAFAEALTNGKIGGLGLDVLPNETNDGGDWLAHSKLAALARSYENVLITPHIGGCTVDSMEKTEVFMAEKLRRFLEGDLNN